MRSFRTEVSKGRISKRVNFFLPPVSDELCPEPAMEFGGAEQLNPNKGRSRDQAENHCRPRSSPSDRPEQGLRNWNVVLANYVT